jgi:hypothetical protein
MPARKKLHQRKEEILQAIASLKPMRKGSVCRQFQRTVRKKGPDTQRGPYPMYTCKKKGKTVGKRLSQDEAVQYRAQIDAFRRFQELCREFAEVSETLADLEAPALEEVGKKNSSRASSSSRKPKPPASWRQ